MLTVALLALTSTADARSATYSKCSGTNPHVGAFTYITTSPACACLKAKDASTSWWGGVNMHYAPEDRPDGTCFENDVWEGTLIGSYPTEEAKVRSNLYSMADAIADAERAWYFPSTFDIYFGWDQASIVSMDEGDEISLPFDPNEFERPFFPLFEPLFPAGPYAVFDAYGGAWFNLITNAPISHVLATDSNDDQITDLVVVFEDGDVWEIEGPVDQGEWIEPPMN